MKPTVKLFLLAALFYPCVLYAQEQEERGQLIMVQEWRVEPSHIAHQDTEIEKLVEAAKQANLKDPGASWHFWSTTNTYTLVYPFENFAYLDDPMAFQKKFKGTPGEAMMQEAFASLQTVPTFENRSEILMHMPGWSYVPENPAAWNHALVTEIWLKPAKEEAFGTLVKEVVDQDMRIGNPYQLHAYRVLFGDVGRFVFVRFYDDQGKFYGENNRDRLLEAAGEVEAWQKMGERFLEMTLHWGESTIHFRPELSYDAPAMDAGH